VYKLNALHQTLEPEGVENAPRRMTAAMHMHEIMKQCTVVGLAWVLGTLPAAVDEIIDEWFID